jgi:nitroreductase
MDTPFDLTVSDKLLSTTRAVRRRLDLSKPVEQQTLLDCIALAQQAPTASNSQTWRWVIVTDKEKRRQIAEIYRSGSPMVKMSREQQADDNAQTQRVYDATEYLIDHMEEVPALVFPCVQGRVSADAHPCVLASVYGSIFPAVWNFQLALRSRGLGSVLTTLHLLREHDVAAILNIPDDVMQVAMLPVAYTIGLDFKPAVRPAPASITHFDTW